MTQLNLFGDQPSQKPSKKTKKPKPIYSSPTIVIIDRRTNLNFNVSLLKVSLVLRHPLPDPVVIGAQHRPTYLYRSRHQHAVAGTALRTSVNPTEPRRTPQSGSQPAATTQKCEQYQRPSNSSNLKQWVND